MGDLIDILTLASTLYVVYLLRFNIMPKQSEIATGLQQANAQLGKVHTEVQGLKDDFEALREAYEAEDGEASPEVVEAFSQLQTRLNGVDELIADVSPAPEAGTGTSTPPAVEGAQS